MKKSGRRTKKGLSSFSASEDSLLRFHRFLSLVISGIRDAYLIDCLSNLSTPYIKSLLPSRYHLHLLLVELDDQRMIANKENLLRKMKNQRRECEAKMRSHYVFDTSRACTTLLSIVESNTLIIQLISVLETQLATNTLSESLNIIHLSSSSVCLPFATGWLLGYPAIYYQPVNTTSTTAAADPFDASNTMSSLSMCQLQKVSISAKVSLLTGKPRKECMEAALIDLLEFTYPLSYATDSEGSDEDLKSSLLRLELLVQERVDDITKRVSNSSSPPNLTEDEDHTKGLSHYLEDLMVADVHKESTVVVMSSLIF